MPDFDPQPLLSLLAGHAQLQRSDLLPVLQETQELYGYIPEDAAVEIGRALRVPLADLSGVIDFYTLLYRDPVGDQIIRVCTDPACAIAGGEAVLTGVCQLAGASPGETSPDGRYTIERSTCLGLCQHAPAVMIGSDRTIQVDPLNIDSIFDRRGKLPQDTVAGDMDILTANCRSGAVTGIDSYLTSGGYRAYRKALSLAPGEIINMIRSSGLVGRGGAAFPTGQKWQSCADTGAERKYVVCNADESEPGTFKDRILMERDPHRVIEGTLIAARAIGASLGYIYIRGEYPSALRSMAAALHEARQAGYLGANVLNSGFDIELEIRTGAGAYICGEETALFESIEGFRGMPRIKPPFPTTSGLFGKPTVINNVETLCNVPFILEFGPDAYRRFGTDRSPGSKLFCLSGDILRPGLYEVPFGTPIRRLIYEMAGGITGDRELGGVLVGGAAGAFATRDHLDIPLTFEDLAETGLPLGSGVLTVFNNQRDIRQVLLGLGRFFAHESCGKCYPCQLGTHRQHEILARIAAGETRSGDMDGLKDVGWTMSDASICGLGQTAATAVLSAIERWPEIFYSQSR